MANRTETVAKQVHGTDPQNLVEQPLRELIYRSNFWISECQQLDPLGLVELIGQVHFIGSKQSTAPIPFMCLLLKLLQIQPSMRIIYALLKQEFNKYLRVLAAFYIRMVGQPYAVYTLLEPLYADYRKVRVIPSAAQACELTTIDQLIQQLLHESHVCSIQFPALTPRWQLESTQTLPPRQSWLLLDRLTVTMDTVRDIDFKLFGIAVDNPLLLLSAEGGGGDGDDNPSEPGGAPETGVRAGDDAIQRPARRQGRAQAQDDQSTRRANHKLKNWFTRTPFRQPVAREGTDEMCSDDPLFGSEGQPAPAPRVEPADLEAPMGRHPQPPFGPTVSSLRRQRRDTLLRHQTKSEQQRSVPAATTAPPLEQEEEEEEEEKKQKQHSHPISCPPLSGDGTPTHVSTTVSAPVPAPVAFHCTPSVDLGLDEYSD